MITRCFLVLLTFTPSGFQDKTLQISPPFSLQSGPNAPYWKDREKFFKKFDKNKDEMLDPLEEKEAEQYYKKQKENFLKRKRHNPKAQEPNWYESQPEYHKEILPSKHAKEDPEKNRREIFEKFDTNKDGKLDSSELEKAYEVWKKEPQTVNAPRFRLSLD